MFEYEITLFHEKDGEFVTSDYCNKPITDENLDFILDYFTSNFGFDIITVKKNGNILSDEEIEKITKKFPCHDKFDEMFEYFHSTKSDK